MSTNILEILIALGDTAAPVVIDRLKRKKDLAGRVEVSSKTYINHKKSIDALVMLIVDEVNALDNLPKNPTNEEIVGFLRGIGDLERSLPMYPIDENALAPFTCGPEPIKYDARDIVDETMQDTILTLIKTTIKYYSLPCGVRNLTDAIIWKRMCALVSLITELLAHTYNCIRNKDIEPPWVINNRTFVARGTQIYLPDNFTVTLLDERKYFTETEEAAMREEENEHLEEEARSKDLMELEQQLPEVFRQEEVIKRLHVKFDTEELLKMIKSFLAFFCRTSINATDLLGKINTHGAKFIDLFYTVTNDGAVGYDVVTYADVGRAFKLFDTVLQQVGLTWRLEVCDTDNGGELVYSRNSEQYDGLFVSGIESPVPGNWMLTINVK